MERGGRGVWTPREGRSEAGKSGLKKNHLLVVVGGDIKGRLEASPAPAAWKRSHISPCAIPAQLSTNLRGLGRNTGPSILAWLPRASLHKLLSILSSACLLPAC